ncbi:MAG: FAD:protein FMN transferase, partial [Shimia sp.]|nr:FAD:protein FMN transferase [Shimia sp.]
GLLAMGRERGMAVAEAHDLAVLFIERDAASAEKTFVTTATSKFAAIS